MAANSDHRNSYHFFPDEVVDVLKSELDALFYMRERRKFYGLDWQEATPFDSAESGEYALHVRSVGMSIQSAWVAP
jgi:hypothetical protein